MEKTVAREKLMGMQVIDARGTIVGSVKDVSFAVGKSEISLVLSTKSGSEMTLPWKDVQGAEDVVLLSRPMTEPTLGSREIPPPQVKQTVGTVACAQCGASAPSAAKFCPKCGAKMKQTGL